MTGDDGHRPTWLEAAEHASRLLETIATTPEPAKVIELAPYLAKRRDT